MQADSKGEDTQGRGVKERVLLGGINSRDRGGLMLLHKISDWISFDLYVYARTWMKQGKPGKGDRSFVAVYAAFALVAAY